MWDAQTGQEFLTFIIEGYIGTVQYVIFSPDGKRLASGSGVGVKVWDAQTGQELLTFKGHTGGVNSVAFSSDGKRLASSKEVARGKVAWTGQNDDATRGNLKLRLYLTTWENPELDKKVVSIDYLSNGRPRLVRAFLRPRNQHFTMRRPSYCCWRCWRSCPCSTDGMP